MCDMPFYESNTNRVLRQIAVLLQKERDLCKRDVCGYCAGHFPQYEPWTDGPNSAGNYTHKSLDGTRLSLCVASSIFARERWINNPA